MNNNNRCKKQALCRNNTQGLTLVPYQALSLALPLRSSTATGGRAGSTYHQPRFANRPHEGTGMLSVAVASRVKTSIYNYRLTEM
eukprot:3999303-Pleurochrysis_carterae.AAC.2